MLNSQICPLCSSSLTHQSVSLGRANIYSCKNCKNAWTVPMPGTIDYSSENFHKVATRHAEHSQRRQLQDLPPQWQQALQMQVAFLSKHLRPHASILEIGCGEGILLEQLQKQEFHVTGIEPSIEASQHARSAGIEVRTGYFPDVVPAQAIDAVILSQVLEHLPDPLETIRNIQKVCPGGKLILIQTNWRGLMPRLLGRKWYAWVPDQHFWHFTPNGFDYLFQKLGIQVIEVQYSSLVHKRFRVLSNVAATFRGWGDQFHLMAQL